MWRKHKIFKKSGIICKTGGQSVFVTPEDLAPSELKRAGKTHIYKTNLNVNMLVHSLLLKYKDKTQLLLT